MKKTLLITIISAMMGIGAAYAGNGTQSLSFNDGNGTPNSGTYNVDGHNYTRHLGNLRGLQFTWPFFLVGSAEWHCAIPSHHFDQLGHDVP